MEEDEKCIPNNSDLYNKLNEFKIKGLKKICRENKIKNYSRLKKNEIIKLIILKLDKNTIYKAIKNNKSKNGSKKNKKKCSDYQWTELIIAILLLNIFELCNLTKQNILDYKDKILNNSKFIYDKNFINKYFDDLKYATDKSIKEYLKNFNKSIEEYLKEIKYVYLTGKSLKNEIFKPIQELIKKNNLNNRQKKGDVYILSNNDKYVSISLKQDPKCYLGNFSIEKFADECKLYRLNDKSKKEREKICTELIVNFDKLTSNEKKEKYNEKRETINNYMYKSDLQIWKLSEKIISNPHVQQKFKEAMYPVVTFNNLIYEGKKLTKIDNHKNIKDFKVERCKLLDTKSSAKIWFVIYINNELKYKAEIRIKSGYLFYGSLQILPTHLNKNDLKKIKKFTYNV